MIVMPVDDSEGLRVNKVRHSHTGPQTWLTYSQGAPYSFTHDSPRGLEHSSFPSWYLLRSNDSSSVPNSLICDSTPNLSKTLAPFGGICIPAPTCSNKVSTSTAKP